MAVPNTVGDLNPVALEEALIEAWREGGTFQNSISQRRGGEPFIFLEGPPTANGKPGIHHVVARTYKDLVCRWKAMEGYFVERKGGWDTHGLPVEIEVQKRLDLMSNEAIEEFGGKDACDNLDAFLAKLDYVAIDARGETVEIKQIKQHLDLAQARADTPVKAPCGCARAALAAE